MTTIYAAMDDALVVIRDPAGGADRAAGPSLEERLVESDLECVAVDPDRPDRVLVGTFDQGLWRSETDGRTWERVGEGVIASDAVTAAAVSPHDPDEVWAGTEPSAVYRSTDGGRTWDARPGLQDLPSAEEWSFPPRPHTHHVRWIEPDPTDPAGLYVAVEAGALVRTDDRGATWQDRPEGARRDNHTLATHPDAPGRVYAAAGDGYAESRDGGDTWTYPQEGLDHRYVWGIAVDPGDPDRVLVSAARGARSAHYAGSARTHVYRRVGDAPWERLDDRGLPTGAGVVRAVLAPGSAAGEAYAVTNRGVFATTDWGDAWDRVAVDWPDRFTEQTPRGLAVTG